MDLAKKINILKDINEYIQELKKENCETLSGFKKLFKIKEQLIKLTEETNKECLDNSLLELYNITENYNEHLKNLLLDLIIKFLILNNSNVKERLIYLQKNKNAEDKKIELKACNIIFDLSNIYPKYIDYSNPFNITNEVYLWLQDFIDKFTRHNEFSLKELFNNIGNIEKSLELIKQKTGDNELNRKINYLVNKLYSLSNSYDKCETNTPSYIDIETKEQFIKEYFKGL